MFDKQYRFKGSHARKVNELTNELDETVKIKLFNRNIDVYVNAPLIGFLYRRRAKSDDEKNPVTGETYSQNIMGDRVIYSSSELLFNFQLIMLLDKDYEPDENKRIDKAFRNIGKNPADEELFDSYVRGGVDVLYEKLIEGPSSVEKIIERLFDFISEFKRDYGSSADIDDLISN